MNSKLFSDAMSKIDDRYVDEALRYRSKGEAGNQFMGFHLKRTGILIAALIAALALCGFAAYQLGLFDPWFHKPSAVPSETVQSAIEGQIKKDYTITVRIDSITVDKAETERMIEMYSGSELAQIRGWTDEYLANHFLAVRAKYYVEYDHAKTFLDDGDIDQYFYLVEDIETGLWTIADNSTNGQPATGDEDKTIN